MQQQEWQLQTSDGRIICFQKQMSELCELLQDKEIDEPLPVALDYEVLEIIKKFCEIHHYEQETIRIKKPICSNKPLDNLDQQSVQVLSLPGQETLFDKVLAASYYLSFELLRQACLCLLACQIYFEDNENDIEKARKQYGLQEITPEQEQEAIKRNMPAFEELMKQFQQQLDNQINKVN